MSSGKQKMGKIVAVPMTATPAMLKRMAYHLACSGVLNVRASEVENLLQGTWAEAIYASPGGGASIAGEPGR